MPSDVGVYQELMDQVLAREWPEPDQWRTEARGKLLELLPFLSAPITTTRPRVH